MITHHKKTLIACIASATLAASTQVSAESTLRLLTWGSYAPDNVVKLFEEKYPDITVEVTYSNNEEMISKLRATRGAGFDLAQPSHDRIDAAQREYNIYKPMDLSQVNLENIDTTLLDGVKANTTIDGKVYSVPHQWGTTGLMVDKTKAGDINSWGDLCDPKYKGKTSMRLKRTILLGMAFDIGEDPFAAYADKAKYQELMNKVTDKMIACKGNIKAYWNGGDDLSAMMLSGEVVGTETWDSTAFKLYNENKNIVFVPPKTGALAWIDTFTLPRKGKNDDAAYKWINFVTSPEIIPMMSASTGAVAAVNGGIDLMPEDKREALKVAFTAEDIKNLKFFANIPPGIEDIEGKALEKIKAAASE